MLGSRPRRPGVSAAPRSWVHQVSPLLASPLQNELAKKAVSDLAAVYGTKYTYGSVVDTICKRPFPFLRHRVHHEHSALGITSPLLSPQTWQMAPPSTGPTTTG